MRIERRYWLVLAVAALLLAAVAAQAQQRTVTVMGTWGGQELEAFRKVLEPFEAATGIRVDFTGTRDLVALLTTRVQAGNPPDVALLPNPGFVAEMARDGHLVALNDVLDMNRLQEEYAQTWLDLGSVDGQLYAIFLSADLKSLVWYNPKEFAARGYEIPATWDELMALTQRIAADGGKAWAIGLESGAASGWPGTD
ncbi:MAG: extracellular solute-binding protein, partial [Limnochordales bacterium]